MAGLPFPRFVFATLGELIEVYHKCNVSTFMTLQFDRNSHDWKRVASKLYNPEFFVYVHSAIPILNNS